MTPQVELVYIKNNEKNENEKYIPLVTIGPLELFKFRYEE
jgi:hypothetical protein